jgi:hypothetical protein
MFTHMAVAGQRIAAVCGDSTINVYDAVTGVLRLTLKMLCNESRTLRARGMDPFSSVLTSAFTR